MVRELLTLFLILSYFGLRLCEESTGSSNNQEEIDKLEHQAMRYLNTSDDNTTHHEIPTQNITELKKEEEAISHMEENEKFTEKLINEMGFNQGKIPKEKFKKFLYRLITKDEEVDNSESEFYYEIIERISKNITEEIDHTELQKHIEHSKFVDALDAVIADKYGPDVLKEIQSEQDEKEKSDL